MQFLTGENRPPLVNPIYPAYLKGLEWAGSHGISDPFLGDGLLYYYLAMQSGAESCVCIGSGGGFVPSLMRQAQQDINSSGQTYLIDADMDVGYGSPGWSSNPTHPFLAQYPDVAILRVKSDQAMDKIESPISYLHIDGDHSYEGVKSDFLNYSPLVKEKGFISIHDISIPGVKYLLSQLATQIPDILFFDRLAIIRA